MKKQERNLGIELLRVICMLTMIIRHLIGHGWILPVINEGTWKFELVVALRSLCQFGVSCFALISGYVGVNAPYRYSALAVQWLKVFLYSAGFTMLAFAFAPEAVGLQGLLESFFPTLNKTYWYFTAYAGCFMLAPLVRIAMRGMDKRQAGVFAAGLALVFCLLNTASGTDAFCTSAGNGVLWLFVLYTLGAYMQQHQPFARIPTWGVLGITLFSAALLAGGEPVVYRVFMRVLGRAPGFALFPRDDSPHTLLLATAMLTLFSRLRITRGRRLVSLLGAASFGVYLIHDQQYVRQYTISRYACQHATLPVYAIVPGIVLTAIGIYLLCAAVDTARDRAFAALKIRQRLCALETRLIGSLWEVSEKIAESGMNPRG